MERNVELAGQARTARAGKGILLLLAAVICFLFVLAAEAALILLGNGGQTGNPFDMILKGTGFSEIASEDESGQTVWLFDFPSYKGEDETPGARFDTPVEKGKEYTFSFDYCLIGDAAGTTVINAASEWNMGSIVSFDDTPLWGKDSYSVTFEADSYSWIYPVFQQHIPKGAAQLYVWNLKLVKTGEDRNLLANLKVEDFKSTMADEGLVSIVDIDPDDLQPTQDNSKIPIGGDSVWLLDFSGYTGENENPNLLFNVEVEKGKTYTFSFQYCVIGESTGTRVINAAKDWGMGSTVAFDNTPLQGKGTYTTTFTADGYPSIYPVFQTYVPSGTPQLYVWDMKLVEEESGEEFLAKLYSRIFQGDLLEAGLVSNVDVDPDTLVPTNTMPDVTIGGDTVWLFDFTGYTGSEENPNVLFEVPVEEGKNYTFRYSYCLIGDAAHTTVINAARDWGLGSNVAFDNTPLGGKRTVEVSFTADYPSVIPVFQTHVPRGTGKLYVWGLELIEQSSGNDLLADFSSRNFRGELVKKNLAAPVNVDPDTLVPTDVGPDETIGGDTVWLFDFTGYTGSEENPSVLFEVPVEKGKHYTFRYSYCLVGDAAHTTVINAAKDWGLGSNVGFDNTPLGGKRTVEVGFTADYPSVIPVFQTHAPRGTAKLYVWGISLVEDGTGTDLLADLSSRNFKGVLKTEKLVSAVDVDPDTLTPTSTAPDKMIGGDTVWLFDFTGYTGSAVDPSALFQVPVEEGKKYTFRYNYCLIGEAEHTTVINAAKEWGLGSKVAFDGTPLQGKGSYSVSFTADHPLVIPVFQAHVPRGAAKLYVWGISLVEESTGKDLLKDFSSRNMTGELVTAKLARAVNVDPEALVPTGGRDDAGNGNNVGGSFGDVVKGSTLLLNFPGYNGSNENPNAIIQVSVEPGKSYTLSFGYYLEEGSGKTTVINAAKDWQGASKVDLTARLQDGKGSYELTFTADHTAVIPVFQTQAPLGMANLYLWDLKLIENESGTNLLPEITKDSFSGELADAGLITMTAVDPDTLGR